MRAAIITIGDEILIGQTIDTNSGYIAKALDKIGIQTIEMKSVSDTREHILEALREYQDRAEVVLMTGGLGPTKDDITKKTLCEYFDDHLVRDPAVLEHVTQLIERFFKRPITELNRDQALVPSKATVLHNAYGTAPGMWLQKNNTVFISMPGVPYEMKGLMELEVIPKLSQTFERPYIIHKNIMTYGVGESLLAERIADWENNLPDTIKLAYLPSPGRVKLRLTTRGPVQKELEDAIEHQIRALEPIIADCLVGYDEDETIEVAVGKLLKRYNLTMSAAESCTGGKIASLITSVSGSSAYFSGSVVTYATATKIQLLHISPKIIEEHTVVSEEVAKAMADAVRQLFQTDYAVATTGNAGPSKGDADAEVGSVCIAVSGPEGTVSEAFQFGQPREKVISRAAHKALEMLRQEILKNVR